MARGTFANIRLVNKFMQKAGPKTLHIPSGMRLTKSYIYYKLLIMCKEEGCLVECFFHFVLDHVGDTMDVFDAAERYRSEGRSLIIIAGRDYGSGTCIRLTSSYICA